MTFIFCGKLFALDLRSKYPRKLNTCGYWVLINFDYAIQRDYVQSKQWFKMLSVGVFLVLLCTFYTKNIHKEFKVFTNNKKIRN